LNHILNLSPLSAFWRSLVKGVTVFYRRSYRHTFQAPFIKGQKQDFRKKSLIIQDIFACLPN
jgi:hypothetical protein